MNSGKGVIWMLRSAKALRSGSSASTVGWVLNVMPGGVPSCMAMISPGLVFCARRSRIFCEVVGRPS